ncbi:MAG: hypothetical protein AAFY71_12380 [Bacteroidota bacterium]
MKKEEDILVDLIRNKLDGTAPVYQDGYWEEALGQIEMWEKEDKQRPRLLFWFWFIGMAMLSAVAFGAYAWYTPSPSYTRTGPPNSAISILAEGESDRDVSRQAIPLTSTNAARTQAQLPSSSNNDKKKKTPFASPSSPTYTQLVKAEEIIASVPTERVPAYAALVIPIRDSLERISDIFHDIAFSLSKGPINPIYNQPTYRKKPGIFISSDVDASGLLSNSEGGNSREIFFRMGTEVELPLNSQWYIRPGLHYVQQPISGLSTEANGRSFSFSFRDEIVRWTPNQASFVQLPLKVGRYLGARHKVEAGLAAQYLLGTKGQLTREITDGFGNTSRSTEELNQIGYGSRNWMLNAQFAYRIQLLRKLEGHILYQLDFNQLPTEGSFQTNQLGTYRGIRFGLNYLIR